MDNKPRITRYEVISLGVAVAAFAISALAALWPIVLERRQSLSRITAMIAGQEQLVAGGLVSVTTTFYYDYDKKGLQLEIVLQNTGGRRQSLIGLHTSLETSEGKERSFHHGTVDPPMCILDAGEAANVTVHYPLDSLPVHPAWCNIVGLQKADIDSVSVPFGEQRQTSGTNSSGFSELMAYKAIVYLWYRLGNQKGFAEHVLPASFIKTSREFHESVRRMHEEEKAGSNKANSADAKSRAAD